MSKPPRLLAFAGSLRSGSFNRLLIQALVVAGREAGAEVDLIDLRDYSLPLYDGDIEALAMPDTAFDANGVLVDAGLRISINAIAAEVTNAVSAR